AIREAEALGFISLARGRGGNAEHRTPSLFGSTFSQHRNSRRRPPTDDWRKIKTIEEAEQIARASRHAKDQRAVAHGKQSWQKRTQKKESRYEKTDNTGTEKPYSNAKAPVRKNHTTGAVGKTVPLSISRGESPARN